MKRLTDKTPNDILSLLFGFILESKQQPNTRLKSGAFFSKYANYVHAWVYVVFLDGVNYFINSPRGEEKYPQL